MPPEPTVAFVGWFGPRGLASVVFGVMLIDDANLVHESDIITTVVLTVGLSVLLHRRHRCAADVALRGDPDRRARARGRRCPGPEHGEVPVSRWRTHRPAGPETDVRTT